MPPYNRIEEKDRWDVVNYIRGLQGKLPAAVPTGPLAVPGFTGPTVPVRRRSVRRDRFRTPPREMQSMNGSSPREAAPAPADTTTSHWRRQRLAPAARTAPRPGERE